MEPYACNNGDYLFLVFNSDLPAFECGPIESELLLEGGEPTGKRGRLSYNPGQCEKISLIPAPWERGWDDIRIIELTLNQEGKDELLYGSGIVIQGLPEIDLYIQNLPG